MNLFTGGPLIPIISGVLCSVLYAGLFTFGFNRIIQKLYAWSTGSMVYKVQLYVYLINAPMIVMILSGVIYNGSLVSLDVALTLDQIYILAISGYICYLEESRQTPLRGFVFIKDLFFILSCIGLYMALNASTSNATAFIAVVIVLYLFNLGTQAFTNELEMWVLLALGFRDKNVYSASFLLTEKSQSQNFLNIKDIITKHEEAIEEEISDFVSVAAKLKRSNEDLQIVTNFARLFLPIKTACELQEGLAKKKSEEQFIENWALMKKDLQNQAQNYQEEEEGEKANSFNHSASTLFIKKTITTDSIFDIDDQLEGKQIVDSLPYKCLKCICYPIYLTTEVGGRMRYFLDYLIVLLLGGTMFLLANSIAYFNDKFSTNQNLVVLIFSGLLFYPVAQYFLRISEGSNDYDFIGIFMHGVIIKFFVLSIALILRDIFFDQIVLTGNKSTMVSLGIRMGTYLVFCIYLVWIRFAMRYNNVKTFVKILIVSEVAQIVSQNLIDNLS